MKQISFADAEYAGKRKQTRRERFLVEMDQVVPWKCLIALIEPHYPKGAGGRPGVLQGSCRVSRFFMQPFSVPVAPSRGSV